MARLTADEFLGLGSLSELEAKYRGRGFEGGGREELLLEAQRDWYEVAKVAAQGVEKPERFEPLLVERAGVTYEIYGLYHGYIGGPNPEYKSFIREALGRLDFAVFENGISWFHGGVSGVTIPDFMVLGALGAIAVGAHVGVYFPIHLWEMVGEVFHFQAGTEESEFDYDPRYHAVDPELRRGLCEDPPLPSRLQIEYEMDLWDNGGLLARVKDPYAIVPRSMFMAGFAVGYAEAHGLKRVPIIVGDLHTTEIQRFLEDASLAHPLFASAVSFGGRSTGMRRLLFALVKIRHLGLAGITGSLAMLPVIALLSWLLF